MPRIQTGVIVVDPSAHAVSAVSMLSCSESTAASLEVLARAHCLLDIVPRLGLPSRGDRSNAAMCYVEAIKATVDVVAVVLSPERQLGPLGRASSH